MMSRSKGTPAAQDAHTVAQPQPIGGTTPEELHAIAIIGKEAGKWRDSLSPGSYPVDVLLRIDGTVEVADEQPRVKTSKPELVDVLAYTLSQLGKKTREKIVGAISVAFSAANGAQAPPQPSAELLGLAQGIVDRITRREAGTVRGNVTGKLNFTRLPGRESPPPGDPADRRAA